MSFAAVAAGVAGSVVGGLISGAGQSAGAQQQAGADTAASQSDLSMFNTINTQEQPFIQSGTAALNALDYGLGTGGSAGASGISSGQLTQGFTPADLDSNLNPGYQFQLQQGSQAIRNADTPAQGALSGSALKDLMNFNQGTAQTQYQNAFNNFNTTQNNIFSRLSGIAGLGQNAATNVGTQGTALGTAAAGLQAGAGAALGAGTIGTANALSGSAVPLSYLMAGNNASSSSGSSSTYYGGGNAYDSGYSGNSAYSGGDYGASI